MVKGEKKDNPIIQQMACKKKKKRNKASCWRRYLGNGLCFTETTFLDRLVMRRVNKW